MLAKRIVSCLVLAFAFLATAPASAPVTGEAGLYAAAAPGGMKLKMIDEHGNSHCHEDGGTCHTDATLQ